MAIKHFQNIEGESQLIASQKLEIGNSLKWYLISENGLVEKIAAIKHLSNDLNNQAWKGYRIWFTDGDIFCTAFQPFLNEKFVTVKAKDLSVGMQIKGANGQNLTVTKVANGKILCGKCQIKPKLPSKKGSYYVVNGVLVGDATIEAQMENEAQPLINEAYLYPKNLLVRGIRKILLPKPQ